MRKDTEKPSFFVRLATVIVDKRKLIFFLYACALLFCLFSRNWVSVCNDITEYLPDSTETRQGLTLMEEEFTTFGTARVMVSHVTRGIAEDLAEQIGEIEGVSSASLGDSIGAEEDGEAETPEDIALALDASRPHVSIYEPVYGDEGEALVMDRITAEEDGTDTALDRVLLQQLMEILDSREKKIVVMRYFRDKTQSEIAAYLGISQVQVSRLENRIMEKLRERALEKAQ